MIRSFLLLGLVYSGAVSAGTMEFPESIRIPDEYEAVGGHSLGFGNGGTAALTGVSAVRVNPAMISLEKTYVVSAGYHWPTFGRDFYQAGVVDSQTSKIGAGVSYTGFSDKLESSLKKNEMGFDSPVTKRLSVGLAQVAGKVALGISGHFISSLEKSQRLIERKKGITLGAGVAGMLTETLRFGLSAENLNNKKMKEYAPLTLRAGLAYMMAGGDVTVQLDLRRRERVSRFETEPDRGYYAQIAFDELQVLEKPEDMVITSFSSRIYDMVRIVGSYGVSMSKKDPRKTLSGGIAIVQKKFSLSYAVTQPQIDDHKVHTNINLNFSMAM